VCPGNLRTVLRVCNSTALCPTLNMVLFKPTFCRCMTRGVSYRVLLMSRAKFSNFLIFSATVLARLWVKGSAISQVLFYSLCRKALYQVCRNLPFSPL